MTPTRATASRSAEANRDIYLDNARLDTLSDLLCLNLDPLWESLGIRMSRSRKMYTGPCPIHGGDNPLGINLWPDGYKVRGFWKCNTRHCEHTFKPTLIGFVRGVLSAQEKGWEPGGSAGQASWKEAVDYCCRVLGQDYATLKVDAADVERKKFIGRVALLAGPHAEARPLMTCEEFRSRLLVPSAYFQGRGYSAEVLDRYDVGDVLAAGKPFSGRALVPVYAQDGRTVVGFTGRSVFEKCGACKLYHAGDCPAEPDSYATRVKYAKWRHNDDFPRESLFYNWWVARGVIARDGYAVLCEGPGEVWRLAEAGCDAGLAMFGSTMTDQQQIALESSGAMSVVVLTNNDAAGLAGRDDAVKRLRRSFRLYTPELPANDLGEMDPASLREFLAPTIAEVKRRK